MDNSKPGVVRGITVSVQSRVFLMRSAALFQTKYDGGSRTSSFTGNQEDQRQKYRHVCEIPIIIETSPEGRANVPFPRVSNEERRPGHMIQKDFIGNVSGSSVGVKINPKANLPDSLSEISNCCSCSGADNIHEQLKDVSLRLKRLEDKIGSDLEGIFDIMKSFKESRKRKVRNSIL